MKRLRKRLYLLPFTYVSGTWPLAACRHPPELQVLGNGTINFRVWIDGQHHTRKITDAETVNGEAINTTVNITAINQPVQIALPPASQTVTPPGA